jgi:hypothetical protein
MRGEGSSRADTFNDYACFLTKHWGLRKCDKNIIEAEVSNDFKDNHYLLFDASNVKRSERKSLSLSYYLPIIETRNKIWSTNQ